MHGSGNQEFSMADQSRMNDRQEVLFNALSRCGKLIFACGSDGIDANIVGQFAVRRHGNEDRLDMGDGARLTGVTMGSYNGESMLTFYHGAKRLFDLYRPSGSFPKEIEQLQGDLA